ncbi:hypothetical protein [Nocardioides lijunqiniae]|uniref:hypothetical protein n=1 Tax=Nocardioides lijunqiniae TaxID=2760832 RepID=UPI0018777A0A|nr:hypothetical protein [Nocardioides lijunqiniae]
MNTHHFDAMTAVALRDLDPAPPSDLTEAELARADAAFTRVVATPHDDRGHDDRGPAEVAPPPRRRRRLLVAVGLVGAAVAVVPALLLGGGSAFASWTPTPEALTAAAASDAAATCRTVLGVPEGGERVVVAERRGGWTYVLLDGPSAEAFCLMPDDLVGHQDAAGGRVRGFFGGYDPDPVEAPVLLPDRIDETESMDGSVSTPGQWFLGDDVGWFSSVQGYVGEDVVGVTVHTPGGPDVQASVDHGRFAAWWPSDPPSSENPEAMGAWTYTVTVAGDGAQSPEVVG